MANTTIILNQLQHLLPLPAFESFVGQHHADRYVKRLTCRNQLSILLFTSDRYAYLPSIAVFALIAMLTDALWQRCTVSRPFLITIGILACSTLTFLTQRQTTYWKNTATLFRHVLDVYPQSAMAHNNLGAELREAATLLQTLLTIDPAYPNAQRHLDDMQRLMAE